MKSIWLCGLLLLCGLVGRAMADEDETPPIKVTTVLSDLDRPTSLAIQPGTGAVFFSEAGAGRIVRITPAGKDVVISGFSHDKEAKDASADIGKLALAFVSRNLLAVAGSDPPDKPQFVRFYEIPAPGKSLDAEKTKFRIGPWQPDKTPVSGSLRFRGLSADGSESVFFTIGGEKHDWIGALEVREEKPGPLTTLLATDLAAGAGTPGGVTVSPRGEVVVGQLTPSAGLAAADKEKQAKSHESMLAFFDPKAKKLLLQCPTGLSDIAGLAYSPRTGWLYAVQLSPDDATKAGLYRLDRSLKENRQGANAVRISALDRPTAAVFAPNGSLYATVLGKTGDKKSDDKSKPTGGLLRISGKL